MQAGENVKMIGCTVDSIQMAIHVLQDAGDVSEQVFPVGVSQRRGTVFHRPYEVVIDLCVGRHVMYVSVSGAIQV